MGVHQITTDQLTISKVEEILDGTIELSEDVKHRIQKCRTYLDHKITAHPDPIYGINTGFGSLCNTPISTEDLGTLQKNLVMSHACGIGDEVPQEIVKLMLLLKVQGLSYGHSGVQLATVERLVDFYNQNITPVVFQQGSLGASGDLAPLAHVALAIMGMGEVYFNGKRRQCKEVLSELDLVPIELKSKEGLALLNGTQFMSAYGVWSLIKTHKLAELADKIGTLSLEAFDGRVEPFDEAVHLVRSHAGQLNTARNIRKYVSGSEIVKRKKEHVQDPYSFRCMPQVHGASKDAIVHVQSVFETEINSVTDNPTIFPDEDKIISAGNFHGQPLAISLDFLAISVAELGSISERRVYKLVAGERGLPPFLVANPGLNSGFMIPQYTAASIVSQNKQLCTPASVDTIDSSQGQEDHVSMGANAATKCHRVVENVQKLLGIEMLNAAQAIEFREEKTSALLQEFVSEYRQHVAFVEDDRFLHEDIRNSIDFIKSL